MDDAEHSRLTYLLDALRVSTGDPERLIRVVDHPGSSIQYRSFLAEIRSSSDLSETVQKIRDEIR